jgi:histidinol phosphatase-like PHP family hydrolase
MRYGVKVSRRAWLEAGDVLNTLESEALLKALHGKRPKKGK